MRAWAVAAVLSSAQGMKGRFVAHGADGLPFLLQEGQHVDFVPPTLEGPRSARVARIGDIGNGKYLVAFTGIHDRDTAERLQGSYCLVDVYDLPEAEEPAGMPEGFADADREGYRIVDRKAGDIGRLERVDASAPQPLLVVEGERGTVLIPCVDEIVGEVDEVARTVAVDLPDGLLELNDPDASGEEDDGPETSRAEEDD
jgi:16S rRNA processing protein RimM